MKLSPGRLLLIALLLLLGGAIAFWPRWMQDTEYAPGYSDEGFASLRVGATQAQVAAVLGEPLAKHEVQPSVSWLYCPPDHPGFAEDGSLDGTFSLITFDAQGVAMSGIGQSVSSQSLSQLVISMDGGPLGLAMPLASGELVGIDVTGMPMSEVEARFGAPRFVDEDRAAERWVYSQSPTGTHYVRVWIGIDAQGRLVEKSRTNYWD